MPIVVFPILALEKSMCSVLMHEKAPTTGMCFVDRGEVLLVRLTSPCSSKKGHIALFSGSAVAGFCSAAGLINFLISVYTDLHMHHLLC